MKLRPGLRPMLFVALLFGGAAPRGAGAQVAPAFQRWAPQPPMGWNSWDSSATTVTEAQTRAHADFMAARLRRYGWQYVVVDIQWYEPEARGYDYRKGAKLVMDEWGRLWPAANRFPTAANGVGFKALADYVRGASVGSCRGRVLTSTDIRAHNTFANPRALEPVDAEVEARGRPSSTVSRPRR